MYLATDARNIRYNGTGRAYAGAVAGSSMNDLGDLESILYNQTVSSEKMKSNRNAARAVILEVESEREGSLTIGLRELTEHNLKMALLGSSFVSDNQAAGYQDLTSTTVVSDEYVELGKLNVSICKVSHGTVTGGPFQVGETVTGGTSGATGKVVWVNTSYIEMVNISGGPFQVGETLTGGTSSATATSTGVDSTKEDVCVVDAASPTTRYVQGTDYSLDPDAGLLRVLSAGSITGNPYVAFNYGAVTRKYMYAFNQGTVEKKLKFVTDRDDRGTRFQITFHKVRMNLNGDFPLLGEGPTILSVSGSVIADTSQPTGQEYFKIEAIPQES